MISYGSQRLEGFFLKHSCVARCSVQYPLVFLEKVCCLVLIMGESRDSGRGLGFGHIAY